MPDTKDLLTHASIKRATKECACTLLESFLEERLNKLSATEVKKLHQLASNWFAGKDLYVGAIPHTAAANDSFGEPSRSHQVADLGAALVLSGIGKGAMPLIDQLLSAALPGVLSEISLPDSVPEQLSRMQNGKTSAAEALCIDSLSPREIEILKLLGRGLSMKGTARGLAISPGTVKWHVKNLYEKLGASSREDALSKARLRQLIH